MMSWTDGEGLERGGDCNECGEPVEEEHHAYCSDCFAEQNGWRRPDGSELDRQRDERERLSLLRLLERISALERRLERLEQQSHRRAAA